MTIFEKITVSPEALGEMLDSLTVINSPWEDEFQKMFCAECGREDCDGKPCLHRDKRNNPLWWLMLEAVERQEVSLEEMPEPLREVKKKYPEVKVYEAPYQISHGLKGKLDYMEIGAHMMYEISKLLRGNNKKFRVTIECNPETGRFEAKHEDVI